MGIKWGIECKGRAKTLKLDPRSVLCKLLSQSVNGGY